MPAVSCGCRAGSVAVKITYAEPGAFAVIVSRTNPRTEARKRVVSDELAVKNSQAAWLKKSALDALHDHRGSDLQGPVIERDAAPDRRRGGWRQARRVDDFPIVVGARPENEHQNRRASCSRHHVPLYTRPCSSVSRISAWATPTVLKRPCRDGARSGVSGGV